MSDTQQEPEWWQASNGKWYPPPRPDWPSQDDATAVAEADPVPAPAAPVPAAAGPPPVTPPMMPPPAPGAPPPTTVAPAVAAAGGAALAGPPPIAPDGFPPGPPVDPNSPVFGPPGTGASPAGDPFGTPPRNKTPLIIGGVIALVIALVIGFVVFGGGDDDDDSANVATESTTDGIGNKEGDPDPSPDPAPAPPPGSDFPEFVDPADAEPMSIDESGFLLLPDEFDEGVTNASYGFVVTNPNEDLAATAVEVSIGLFDEAGTAVETESAFVSGLLGKQTVGMGGFIRDVPAGVVRIDVTASVSQLVRTGDLGGELTVSDVQSAPEEFGGLTVTFKVSSSFGERQEDISLYGVFRDEAGVPVGGAQSFLEFVEPNGTSNAELRSFADVPGITDVDVTVTISSSVFFD